jgi:hypothetical protein
MADKIWLFTIVESREGAEGIVQGTLSIDETDWRDEQRGDATRRESESEDDDVRELMRSRPERAPMERRRVVGKSKRAIVCGKLGGALSI